MTPNRDASMSHPSLFACSQYVSCGCMCLCVGADGWDPTGKTRIAQYPGDVHRPQLSPGFPLTVKDLLLSGTPEPVSVCRCDRVGGDGGK